jgi:8-oxo-dGTP pyrophosphatase MutT (NUDIX family)
MSDYLRRLREKVGNELLMMPAVAVIIFDEQGRILVGKHRETERWVTPGGGVDPHEIPADAAVREMWEETGLLVEPIRVIGVYGGPEFHITYANGDEVSCLAIVFECRIIEGTMQPDNIELTELMYVSQTDLASLELPAWMHCVLTDVFDNSNQTRFNAPTWNPPANGFPKGGISKHIRRLREKIGHDLLSLPIVGGLIYNEQGHILLQKRSDNGQWEPPEGVVEPDESPADAVVREVWEETGLVVESARVTGVYGGPEFYHTFPNGDQCALFSITFECQVIGGRMRPDGIESLDVRYFAPQEIIGDFLPKCWQRRMADALKGQAVTHFDPPIWQPPVAQPLRQHW